MTLLSASNPARCRFGVVGNKRSRTVVLALTIFLAITSVLMILLVLLHKGKGSGLSDLFGGGISSTYGGSSVVEKNLDRITIVVGFLWFAGVVSLGIYLK